MINIILAALASYRLAILISNDTVPFEPLRLYIGKYANKSKLGYYLAEGINCHHCVGMWTSLFFCLLVIKPKTLKDLLVYWFAVAGLQIKLGEENE
jgi:hypothetical protein